MQQQDELIGTQLGKYRILSSLGQGGMARGYKAYQENLDREVAVKVLPPWYAADRNFISRFHLEARLIARLSHPNIVTVHDASEQNGHLYIVMQLVDGGTLKQRFERLQQQGKLMETAEIVTIFTQIGDALAYAHEQGVIHRDIKPVNVLMDQSNRPILSDFGIAKVIASTQLGLTHPGAGVGTPEYMSPEQCQGGPVDGRADIYALGVMLFEAQTGRTPFVGDNYPALAHSHIYEPPPRPSVFNPAIHPAIEHIILKALMKDPQQRFQTAGEMVEMLKQALNITSGQPAAYYTARSHPQSQLQPQVSAGSPRHRQISPPLPQPSQPSIPSSPARQALLYRCYHCQQLNKAHIRFCVRCGAALNQCRNCGEHNQVSNRFCTRCGTTLEALR
ncbi:MAG: protein kinase [Ktedonobacteraceae bacterium]|nr:protein kinase [Ktedonobacteraceae bacterium]